MKKIVEKTREILEAFLRREALDFSLWPLSIGGLIVLRLFIEVFLAVQGQPLSIGNLVVEYIQSLLFFFLVFCLIWLSISFVLAENPRKYANFALFGFWLVLLPPIIDMLKTQGQVYWSFYVLNDWQGVWSQFFSFFGNFPSGIVYFGTKVTFFVAILGVFGLIRFRFKSYFKAAFGAFLAYLSIFLMGNFPNFLAFAYYSLGKGQDLLSIQTYQVAQFLASPARIFGLESIPIRYAFAYNLNLFYYIFLIFCLFLLFFLVSREKFIAVLKNFRYPQVIYHGGLFFTGLGLGLLRYPENYALNIFSMTAILVLLAGIFLAWKASIIVNDIYDFRIDSISGPWRPLPKKIFTLDEYKSLGIIVFLLALLAGLSVGLQFAVLIVIYEIIAFFYSGEPYRLKRFPGIATFISSICSLIILFMGFIMVSGRQNIAGLTWRVILLIIIAFTLSLPIKDFKDIEGDRKFGVWTLPVIFGEYRARLITATGIFTSFMASVFFLNEMKLFFWALLFGAAAFLFVANQKIKPANLFWWVLVITFIYGLILVKIVFF